MRLSTFVCFVILIRTIRKARNAVGQGQTTDIPESVRKTCEVAGIICIGSLQII